MPVYIKDDLWKYEGKADLIVISTNSYIKKDGELVMGRGLALQAKNRYPELPRLFGQKIPHLGVYGLVVVKHQGKLFGAFQVKRHFRDRAEIALIENSTRKLRDFLKENPVSVVMNFPGIGYGRLRNKVGEIKEILDTLPENVQVFNFVEVLR